ncbi:pyrroline-5-carboxylate reductase [Polaromonas hydrogenivorans]|uniref:Pyrroline-5-carboxylate reductase n=1 Tax=Polaromonas hydrogenivorans TaxID=335476 RepID=A0AAU7LSF2_9BURK
MTPQTTDSSNQHIAFIGGGNMASAIIGGLLKRGLPASQIQVVEPFAEQRARLAQQFQVEVSETAGASLARATLVVWAVKPQTFRQAAEQSRAHTPAALHLSVAAGIRSSTIAGWLGTERVVRAMPNTPALIGQGMTALFARPAASAADRLAVERVVQTTGEYLWLDQEAQLDAVTALSGSGPAYVFYFIEAMIEAGTDMGLSREQAQQLAMGTFAGASALAHEATEPPEVLRARVTSKGGTTYAALTSMERDGIKEKFMQAMHAARQRASEMGDEFGAA